jgi:hypothetical protein
MKCVSDVHQSESEQVQAGPQGGNGGSLVVRPRGRSPDPLGRADLDQNLRAGSVQAPGHVGVLGGLREGSGHDDVVAGTDPAVLVEATDLTASRFGRSRATSRHDLRQAVLVVEQAAFSAIIRCSAWGV